ncbi:UPF0481 protein At3g47200-like isoform X2 [Carya illinoinensis]|uniref:Uncharacterized protein n=2 Tax=Carya illinoinensis TaxID=32201 RepID=A0A8T1Q024_CARIL|nr:UPF0481 protein At3g47200-like isoform X2 [Carya illinoinensis]KAG6645869.1 hypothetical protein CIPAW_08G153300 [Carya illinoinensis]KAG6645870.1 hypothetical protein CIPAW_08G153300 [Carya illinoinensis]
MEKSTSYGQEIQPKVATTALVTNGNQNHAETHQLDQKVANTLSSGNGNQHIELVISIKEMVESSLDPPLSSNECCIYRIPIDLLKLNEEAYTPQIISIGPFHHGSKRLEPMEKLKLKYFKRFLQRIDFNVEILVNDIKQHEESVRGCYAESIKLSSDAFVKLILVDGCFLIELFYELRFQGAYSVSCENLLNPLLLERIILDLKLLENQLPLFALDILFRLACAPDDDEHPSFTSLAIKAFEVYNDWQFPENREAQQIRHFVDLTKTFFVPSSSQLLSPQESNDLPSAVHLYTASQLYKAGVKFKVSSSKCLFDLKFTNGTLEIPYIGLDNTTETIYRNVIAFEQCHYPCDSHFTDYIVLLNLLINTPKDVELLIRKGIIMNGLSNNDAVASLFNDLGTNISYDGWECAYRGLFRDLNAFYSNTKHTWKATLKRDYFGTPWKIASTTGVITLLLLTLVQAICSIIQVVKM